MIKITKEKMLEIINEILSEDIIVKGKNPAFISNNKKIIKKYIDKYPNVFKNSEIIYIFENKNNIEQILENMFCECGNKKIYTSRKDKPYQKFCSYSCRNKNEEYNKKRYSSWIETYNNKTKEEKQIIKDKSIASWKKSYYSKTNEEKQTIKDKIQNVWKNKNKEELKEFKNKISIISKENWKNRIEEEKQQIVIKSKQTKFKNYGDENYTNREKAIKTCLEHYGVKNVSQIKDVIDKIKNIINSKSLEEKLNIQEKRKKTCLKLYGKEHYSQTDEYKNLFKNEEWNNEIREKSYKTKKKNNSFSKSDPEDKCYILLKQKFKDAERWYRSKLYPFECDYYIPSLDLYIELHLTWTHQFKPFDINNEKHIEKLNELKIKSKKSDYYKNVIYTWTDLDVRKLKAFKENNLNYKIFYYEKDFLNWLDNQ